MIAGRVRRVTYVTDEVELYGSAMGPVRHRRRLTLVRVAAFLAPLIAVALAVVAVITDGPWPRIAAGTGAVAATALGALVIRLDRQIRVEVNRVRAEQSAAYNAEHARYAEQHRDFTDHMVGLLDVASERIDVMRTRLDTLESEISAARTTRRGATTPSTELARFAEGAEWNDLWPDLADAPTVVNLVAWDDRNRDLIEESPGSAVDVAGDAQERTA